MIITKKNVTAELSPIKNKIDAEVEMPGCLSYTTRALNLASMSDEIVTIKKPLKSDDTLAMLNCLKTLGIETEEGQDYFKVIGSVEDVKEGEYNLYVNLSGRTARSILPLCCIVKGVQIISGEKEFNERRPIKDLVDGLRQLGAKIEYLEKEGYLPVKITGSKLNPGKISMRGNISSQYFSGILMIAPKIGEIEIEVIGEQTSKSYLDITFDIMKTFGVRVENFNYKKYFVESEQKYNLKEYTVEGDASGASYFWAIGVLNGGKIKVKNINPNSAQGDVHFTDLLEKMGCKITKNSQENWVKVEGTEKLKGINCNMNSMPDTATTLGVVACYGDRPTRIEGLDNLRVKETDRIESPQIELAKMSIQTESTEDTLTVYPGTPTGAKIKTYSDHRIAMSFAVLGSKIDGVKILNAEVVNKSFPEFWDKIEGLGVKINFV
jgi:3-phosphoshikimate 1-carboxyvinyltransferase